MRRSVPLAGAIPETSQHSGFALGRKGFRPFFLLAGLFAVAIVPIWLAVLSGALGVGTTLDPFAWHAHEMVFGFSTAVIAGFLLTAVGNWTQRETLVGGPLVGLAALWLAGRVALVLPIPRGLAAAIDLAFLPVLAVVLARPLIATKNKRNFIMLAVLAVLWAANLSVHMGYGRQGSLVATDIVILLCVIITGRVVPMFTKNATGVQTIRSVPALDLAAPITVGLAAVAGATLAPDSVLARAAFALAAITTAVRMVTWSTTKVLRVPLLWILHAGCAWISIGFALRALAVTPALATHALTIGAVGSLTLGMMARVSLGHSGRPLEARPVMALSFALLELGVVARVFGGLLLPATAYKGTLHAAGTLWTLAFLIFVVVYTPVLTSPRLDGKPG